MNKKIKVKLSKEEKLKTKELEKFWILIILIY